jgi:hypothetical protein
MWNRSFPRYSGPGAGQGGPHHQPYKAALSPFSEGGCLMLTSRICREHSAKCIQTANSLPPGPQREMFLDMAHRWTVLAAKIENEELDQVAEAEATEAYRFWLAHKRAVNSGQVDRDLRGTGSETELEKKKHTRWRAQTRHERRSDVGLTQTSMDRVLGMVPVPDLAPPTGLLLVHAAGRHKAPTPLQ